MLLYAMYKMEIQRGENAVEAMLVHLKQHTILALNIKKLFITVGRDKVPQEMMDAYKASSKVLGELLAHCFNDTSILTLEDCRWDTNDVLTKEEGGRHTPFFNNYRPQFYFRTTDVTGAVELPKDKEMVMPGDNVSITVDRRAHV